MSPAAGRRLWSALLEEIVGDGMIVIAMGGAGAAPLAAATKDPLLADDPGDPPATDPNAVGLKFDPDTRAAGFLAVRGETDGGRTDDRSVGSPAIPKGRDRIVPATSEGRGCLK